MTEETAALVKEILEKMLAHLSVPASVDAAWDGIAVRAEAVTEDPAAFGGDESGVLEALQYLAQRIAGRKLGDGGLPPVVVDLNGRREKREIELRRMAEEVSGRIGVTGGSELLQPMTSWERKIVHVALRDKAGIETRSEDSRLGRRVRIRSWQQAPPGGMPRDLPSSSGE